MGIKLSITCFQRQFPNIGFPTVLTLCGPCFQVDLVWTFCFPFVRRVGFQPFIVLAVRPVRTLCEPCFRVDLVNVIAWTVRGWLTLRLLGNILGCLFCNLLLYTELLRVGGTYSIVLGVVVVIIVVAIKI